MVEVQPMRDGELESMELARLGSLGAGSRNIIHGSGERNHRRSKETLGLCILLKRSRAWEDNNSYGHRGAVGSGPD
jgi:hypothetical protein